MLSARAVVVEGLGVVIDVERRVGGSGAGGDQLVGGGGLLAVESATARRAGAPRRASSGSVGGLTAGRLQQRVALQLLGQEALDLEVAERQQT